jgi:hypothetical protein
MRTRASRSTSPIIASLTPGLSVCASDVLRRAGGAVTPDRGGSCFGAAGRALELQVCGRVRDVDGLTGNREHVEELTQGIFDNEQETAQAGSTKASAYFF